MNNICLTINEAEPLHFNIVCFDLPVLKVNTVSIFESPSCVNEFIENNRKEEEMEQGY